MDTSPEPIEPDKETDTKPEEDEQQATHRATIDRTVVIIEPNRDISDTPVPKRDYDTY